MVAIWSMLFCDACGNLLPRTNGPDGAMIPCDDCGASTQGKNDHYLQSYSGLTNTATDTSAKIVTSKSKPSAFPSVLRTKHSAVQTLNVDELNTEAIIQKDCPNCKSQEMFYHTKQLRSADEGSTVFYRCECGYQYVAIWTTIQRLRLILMQGKHEQLRTSCKRTAIFKWVSIPGSRP